MGFKGEKYQECMAAYEYRKSWRQTAQICGSFLRDAMTATSTHSAAKAERTPNSTNFARNAHISRIPRRGARV
jgi:hypothetical protein